MNIRAYNGTIPVIDPSAYIDDLALVIGKVNIGADSSVWPMTVIRGDVNSITIGHHTNIQDGSVLHVTHEREQEGLAGCPLKIGNYVTVGHRVLLHGCTIGDYCLIGMGAVVMDKAVLDDRVMVGAGSLVSPGKHLESGNLYVGNPVRNVRKLTGEELAFLDYSAGHYVELKDRYTRND